MKTIQDYMYYQILASCFCISPLLVAETSDQPSLVVNATLCKKEVLMTFFPQPVVKAVLIHHDISEDQAQEIAQELSQKDQEVIKMVEAKASKLDPNPFSDLSTRDAAVKIFRETLFEVFAKVLKAHDITDDNQIQLILEDMQAAKGKLFVECIKKERPPSDQLP